VRDVAPVPPFATGRVPVYAVAVIPVSAEPSPENAVAVTVPATCSFDPGVVVPIPTFPVVGLRMTSPLEAFEVDSRIRSSPDAVPPLRVCPPLRPAKRAYCAKLSLESGDQPGINPVEISTPLAGEVRAVTPVAVPFDTSTLFPEIAEPELFCSTLLFASPAPVTMVLLILSTVVTPAFVIVTSPDKAKGDAMLEPFPTQMLALVRVAAPPTAESLLLNVTQSAALIKPAVEEFACAMLIVGVEVPFMILSGRPPTETLVTVPPEFASAPQMGFAAAP
jgi:hypothetical protein